MHPRRVSLPAKLALLLGLNQAAAQAIIDGDGAIDMEQITAHAILDRPTVAHLVAQPSAAASVRIDPNRLRAEDIRRIPGLKPEQAAAVAMAMPYYTMAEVQATTRLPRSILEEVFAIPPFCVRDKPASKAIMLEPVPGRYIVPTQTEFEADAVLEQEFDAVYPATDTFAWRVVEISSFENVQAPLHLKQALRGQVHPVLRDAQGFERYLVPGSLDLWFRRETAEDRRRAMLAELGLLVADAHPQVGYYRVHLADVPTDHNSTRAVVDIIERAQQWDEVLLAEPDQVGFEDFGPDYGVAATGTDDFEAADMFWNHDAIALSSAHEVTTGSEKVIVIIVDSGTRMTHPDLESAFPPDWSTLDLNFDLGVPEAALSPHELTKSHGTEVAGVVGGQGSVDPPRARGVATGCRVLPVKIPGIAGGPATPGYGLRAAAIFQALTYLKPDERAVLNLSWKTNGEHIGIREALREAQRQNVAIVTSAGNYVPGAVQRPDDLHYPSAHAYLDPTIAGLCSVAAVGYGDHKATYSYYGRQSITVAAPGGEPPSVGPAIYTSSTPEQHVFTAGTSFAAPHVAGLIALLFSVNADLTATQAVQIIADTADKIDHLNPTYAGMLGAGRINARAALEKVTGGGGHAPLPTPTDDHHDEMGRLNVNLATREELLTLPLVGPWRATRLLEYRDMHGPFTSIWQLTMTGVFDAWAIHQLEPWITV